MKNIFKIIRHSGEKTGKDTEISVGISVTIADRDFVWPLTKSCTSYEALTSEMEEIRDNLEMTLEEGRLLFYPAAHKSQAAITSEMSAKEAWGVLSEMEQSELKSQFNSLDHVKRKTVAEYVLTQTNIFSGNASYFSSSYNNESGLME